MGGKECPYSHNAKKFESAKAKAKGKGKPGRQGGQEAAAASAWDKPVGLKSWAQSAVIVEDEPSTSKGGGNKVSKGKKGDKSNQDKNGRLVQAFWDNAQAKSNLCNSKGKGEPLVELRRLARAAGPLLDRGPQQR